MSKTPFIEDSDPFDPENETRPAVWGSDHIVHLLHMHSRNRNQSDDDLISKTWMTEQEKTLKGLKGIDWVYNQLTERLAGDIEFANKDHVYKLGYNVKDKYKDQIQEAFCRYGMLKMKLNSNIYENVQELITDTLECQKLLREISQRKIN